MTASRARGGSYVNVRSEDCVAEPSAAAPERGVHIVAYGGDPYIIVGMYFARRHHSGRELWYILAPARRESDSPGSL